MSAEADGKNSVLGELLVSIVRAPEPVQEAILVYALKVMNPYRKDLIDPYPMLAHMHELLKKHTPAETPEKKHKKAS